MARLSDQNIAVAREILARYPRSKSALVPLLHLAQEQDGYVTDEAMAHIAELVGCSSAEVMGTATFYEMFKFEPVGKYMVNVCTNIACQLLGAEELLDHAEKRLGIKAGQTTPDGMFTIEDVECVAACTEAPCVQVNYRYFDRVTPENLDQLLEELAAGSRDDEVPPHGVLARVRQHIPADKAAGAADPAVSAEPVWMKPKPEGSGSDGAGGGAS